MAIDMVLVDHVRLGAFAHEAFRAMGLSDDQAQICADALMFSELRFHPGQGQGVRRLRAYRDRLGAGQIDPNASFEVAKEGPALNERDGSVILSTNAGVFEEIGTWCTALNPFDISETVDWLESAFSNKAASRAQRASMARMLKKRSARSTPRQWLDVQLEAAGL